MPIFGNNSGKTPAKTQTDFNIGVTDVASDVVTVPAGKVADTVSIWNDGPQAVRVKVDATATPTDGILLKAGEGYADNQITVTSRLSVIVLVAGGNANVRGVVWSS